MIVVDLNEVKIYRITHIDNIPHIMQYGITHRNSATSNSEYKSIGDTSLIDTRSTKTVYVDNGDYGSGDRKPIVLGDFVPFYFGVRMPMLYVAQHGGNFVKKAYHPEEIVYIACSLVEIISNGNRYYFSDGHATDMLTTFFNKDKIDELTQIIDWTAVKSSYWGGQENLNIKRKKQAEFLVYGDISAENIIGFGCYNEKAKEQLISFGCAAGIVKVIPKAYFNVNYYD